MKLLGIHNSSAPMDEGQHLQDIYPAATKLGGTRFGLNIESFLNETSSLVTVANRDRLLTLWGQYWDANATVFLEKSPPNIVRMRFFQSIFRPYTTYFIVVIRHPFDVMRLSEEQTVDEMISLLSNWVICYEKAREDSKKLNNVVWIKFEQFVRSPRIILRSLYHFLALPPARFPIVKSEKVRKVIATRFGFIGEATSSRLVIYPTEAFAYRKLIPISPTLNRILKNKRFLRELRKQEKTVKSFGYNLLGSLKELLSSVRVDQKIGKDYTNKTHTISDSSRE